VNQPTGDRGSAIADIVRERGPITVAAFMELALYDPHVGYYARAVRRSGRAGDFFTSVDVGTLFGELLEVQIAEMMGVLGAPAADRPLDLVEVAAGNGRLAADVLSAMKRRHPEVYARTALSLVERSPSARWAQAETLGDASARLRGATDRLPESFEGVLFANELLDAMPVHQVVMRHDGLREVFVEATGGALRAREGRPSTDALQAHLDRLGVSLEPGWRAEINLAAVEWVRDAARRLRRGFMLLIDYGHGARELYSARHSSGTLTTFSQHTADDVRDGPVPSWLRRPGEQDITAHVDFTSIQHAANAEGLSTLGFLDQTYFLLGLVERAGDIAGESSTLRERLALKTLILPGGMGSTMKVLILGKGVGTPRLSGCSYAMRAT
jgi:SAM-dependent MidA family methyltransferase